VQDMTTGNNYGDSPVFPNYILFQHATETHNAAFSCACLIVNVVAVEKIVVVVVVVAIVENLHHFTDR
jgi:hypothetical protein